MLLTFCPGQSVYISLCSTVLDRYPSKLCKWPPCRTSWNSCCTCFERSLRSWRQRLCSAGSVSWLPFLHGSGEILVSYLRWQSVPIMPVKAWQRQAFQIKKYEVLHNPSFHLLTKLSCHLSATELRKGWSQQRVDVHAQKWLTYLPFKMITTVSVKK